MAAASAALTMVLNVVGVDESMESWFEQLCHEVHANFVPPVEEQVALFTPTCQPKVVMRTEDSIKGGGLGNSLDSLSSPSRRRP